MTPDIAAQTEKVLALVNDVARSDLSRYVVHRKLILDLLDKSLGYREDGTYRREQEVHRIIYPMGTDSDSLADYEQQNLWIVDERLSYHSYLASDKPLTRMRAIETSAHLRPDITIYNRGLAYADGDPPYDSVVILEFKRPDRKGFSQESNPLAQVYAYIRAMRSGTAKDDKGRPLHAATNAAFYVYLIADLTPALTQLAQDGSFTKTPDGLGYFGYNTNYGAYVEIVSYTKLIIDAKRRNRVLFDKLGLPPVVLRPISGGSADGR
jgi:hypothetical protein